MNRQVHSYTHMQVWDGTGNGCMNFDAQDLSEAENRLGYIIENRQVKH